jgi:hypothetical protein
MRSESLSDWADPKPEVLRDTTLGSLLVEEARLSHEVFAARTGIAAEPLTARTYLELLAVRAAIARALMWGSQADVRDAIEAGATWNQVALARGTTPNRARADFQQWVDAQAALWDSGASPSGVHFGLSPQHRQVVRALADRPD